MGGIEESGVDFSEAFTENDQKRMNVNEKEFVFIQQMFNSKKPARLSQKDLKGYIF